jgi:hypothetical protein
VNSAKHGTTGSWDGFNCINLSLTNQKPCVLAVHHSTNYLLITTIAVHQMHMKEHLPSTLVSFAGELVCCPLGPVLSMVLSGVAIDGERNCVADRN